MRDPHSGLRYIVIHKSGHIAPNAAFPYEHHAEKYLDTLEDKDNMIIVDKHEEIIEHSKYENKIVTLGRLLRELVAES